MSHVWKNLTGKELSDFAASPQAQHASVSFVKHLAIHGTYEDFASYINNHPRAVEKCCAVYSMNPQAARTWLLEQLSVSVDQKKDIHATIAFKIMDRALPKILFSHINVNKIENPAKRSVFFRLMDNGWRDLVIDNWGAFAPIAAKQPKECVIYALSLGCDLSEHISWAPKTPDECDEYIVACCRGGFLQRVKPLTVTNPTAVVDAFSGVLMHQPKNAKEILEYLWETYPNASWNRHYLLFHLVKFSLPLSEKLVDYLKQTDHTHLKHAALHILEDAIDTKKIDIVNLALPHIASAYRLEALRRAAESGYTPTIERVLTTFTRSEQNNLVRHIPPEYANLVEEVLNRWQSQRVLEKVGKNMTRHSAQRKM